MHDHDIPVFASRSNIVSTFFSAYGEVLSVKQTILKNSVLVQRQATPQVPFVKKSSPAVLSVSPIMTVVFGTPVKSPQCSISRVVLLIGLRLSPSLVCADVIVVNPAMHVVRECKQAWGLPFPAFAPFLSMI